MHARPPRRRNPDAPPACVPACRFPIQHHGQMVSEKMSIRTRDACAVERGRFVHRQRAAMRVVAFGHDGSSGRVSGGGGRRVSHAARTPTSRDPAGAGTFHAGRTPVRWSRRVHERRMRRACCGHRERGADCTSASFRSDFVIQPLDVNSTLRRGNNPGAASVFGQTALPCSSHDRDGRFGHA